MKRSVTSTLKVSILSVTALLAVQTANAGVISSSKCAQMLSSAPSLTGQQLCMAIGICEVEKIAASRDNTYYSPYSSHALAEVTAAFEVFKTAMIHFSAVKKAHCDLAAIDQMAADAAQP